MLTPESTNPERYPTLDGVRGLAVLLVFASHVSNARNRLFAGDGEFGVWLFFVLSAFLLSLYFFRAPQRMRYPIEWANYAFRRFMRIYPLYFVGLLCGAVAAWWPFSAVWDGLLLRTPAYWAVYVEFRFYFLLPLFVVLFVTLGRFSFWLPLLIMIATVGVHYAIFPDGSTVLGYASGEHLSILFPEYLIVFIIGVFTAWVYVHTPRLRDRLARSRSTDCFIVAMLAILFLASPKIVQSFFPDIRLDYYDWQWVPWSAFFALMIYLVMTSNGIAKRLFESRPMRFFGFISYSLYLFMDFPINALAAYRQNPRAPFAFTLTLVVPVLIAWASFVLIERPLSRLSLMKLVKPLSVPDSSMPRQSVVAK
jgi:peptidoglycan/LPS O-acetylase OafA/YrhL